MKLPSRDLFNEVEDVLSRMNREWGSLINNGFTETPSFANWSPTVDIKETKNAYQIKVELPGVDKKDVSVNIENGVLTIRGEKKTQKEEDEDKVHRVECSYGSFYRSFALPGEVNIDKSNAHFKDGVLTLKLPKSDEQKKKQLEIKID